MKEIEGDDLKILGSLSDGEYIRSRDSYTNELFRCPTCGETKKRIHFMHRHKGINDNKQAETTLCNDCRVRDGSIVNMNTADLKWDRCDKVDRPSIIDWMESKAKQ